MLRALASLVLVSALPAAFAAQIEVSAIKSGGIDWAKAEVLDAWPEGCAPQVDKASVEEHDIILHAVLPDAACGERAASADGLIETRLQFVLPPLWSGVYHVRYEVSAGIKAPTELHAFRLVDFDTREAPAPRPETGVWWPEQGGDFDRGGPGMGVLMEAQANTLSLTVLGYGADGQAQWFYGASAISGHLLDMELAQLSEGAGPFEAYRAPKGLATAGSVQIELLSPARANLWFLRPYGPGRALSVEPLSMVRFSFAQTTPEAWLGRWVVAAESGDTPASRHIDFVAIEPTPTGFALIDARGEYSLDCETAPSRPNSPPLRCDLLAADNSPEIRFDRTALSELRGRTLTGEPVAALKLGR